MQNTQKTQTQEEAVRAHFTEEACNAIFTKFPATFFGADKNNEDLSIFEYETLTNSSNTDLLEILEGRIQEGYRDDEIGEFEAHQLRECVDRRCQTLGFRTLKTDPTW